MSASAFERRTSRCSNRPRALLRITPKIVRPDVVHRREKGSVDRLPVCREPAVVDQFGHLRGRARVGFRLAQPVVVILRLDDPASVRAHCTGEPFRTGTFTHVFEGQVAYHDQVVQVGEPGLQVDDAPFVARLDERCVELRSLRTSTRRILLRTPRHRGRSRGRDFSVRVLPTTITLSRVLTNSHGELADERLVLPRGWRLKRRTSIARFI